MNQDGREINAMFGFTVGSSIHKEKVDLSFRGLSELPAELFSISGLKELNVNYNQLVTLPPEIGRLTCLEKLVLSNNRIHSLPVEISSLQSLTELNLSNNQVDSRLIIELVTDSLWVNSWRTCHQRLDS